MSANGELLVIAIFLVAMGAGGIHSSSAHAEEDCLAAPSGRPPPGSQWHYRTDHVKQRKCWHMVGQGDEGQTAPATATYPAAKRPETPPDHLGDQKLQAVPETTAGLRGSTAPASTQDGGAGRPATPAWPDPPSPAAPDNMAWPDPPSPTHAGNVVWPDPPAPILADKAEGPKARMLDRNIGSDAGSERQVAAETATSYSKMSVGVLLIVATGLVIAGILLRRWVIITLGRRSRRDLTQRAPSRRNAVSGRVASVVSDDETRRALQKLLQVLEQQAVRG